MGNQPEAVDQQEAGAANHKRNNIEEIAAVIDYIEEHLMEEKMDLESIPSAPDVCICGRLSPAHLSYEAQAD